MSAKDEDEKLSKAYWLEEALRFADEAQGFEEEPVKSFLRILAEAAREGRGPEREIDDLTERSGTEKLAAAEGAHLRSNPPTLQLSNPPEGHV